MLTLMRDGGPFMWLLLLLFIMILGLAVRKFIQLIHTGDEIPSFTESGINAIVFWGAVSAVIGFFAHYLGIYHAMIAISRASDISPAIVSYGYSMSLIPVLAGLLIFLVSAIIWFLLRWRLKHVFKTQS
jgi:hypothetical protein